MDGTKMTTFTTQDRQDAQRTPLTDLDILAIAGTTFNISENRLVIEFARAIERAHGITE